MKYVLVIAIVLVVLWLLRPRRRVDAGAARRGTAEATERMVICAHCGVHLPASDALPGRGGVFCGEAHRAAHEATHAK